LVMSLGMAVNLLDSGNRATEAGLNKITYDHYHRLRG
jgi:hypothetical protein